MAKTYPVKFYADTMQGAPQTTADSTCARASGSVVKSSAG